MGRIKDDVLFQLISDFLQHYLPEERHASPNTIKAYRTALSQLLDFISEETGKKLSEVTADNLTSKMVKAYLNDLAENKKLGTATRNNRLASIKAFLNFCAGQRPEYMYYLSDIEQIPSQKQDVFRGVTYMSEHAVEVMLTQPDTKTRRGVRDQFFMILLYDTGARVQEMIDLRVCDVKVGKTMSATLQGKGSKMRQVPLMKETKLHFEHYMSVYHPDENAFSTEPLFYIERHGARQKMSDDNVRKFLEKYRIQAKKICPEIPENVHPHLWRHSRAMHLYQNGMDLTLIAQWLGHVNIETTLIYAHADTEMKRKAIEKAMKKRAPTPHIVKRYVVDDEDVLRKLYGLAP